MTSLPLRARALVAHDGSLARILVVLFHVFVVSASFLAANAPMTAFGVLVGWQPTHLAIGLFAASFLPVVPSLSGLLAAADAILDDGSEARAGRAFWHGFGKACRGTWPVAVAAAAVAGILSYDVALFAAVDGVVIAAAVGAALLVMAIVAIAALPDASHGSVLARVSRALSGAARRPHVALAWLLLAAISIAICAVPLIGPSLMFFSPALGALAIQICNRTLGFARVLQESDS